MQLPVKLSYRGLEKSDQIDNLVLDYAARLERFCDHINRCDVAIEQTNHTHQKGNPYRCRIDVTVAPRHELVADEKQMDNGTHEPSKKSSTTHLKPWSASCVALWKSKGVTSKPTPTCVRRNNFGSPGRNALFSRCWQQGQLAAENESVACCWQMYFFRPQQISPPPASLSSTYNAGPTSFASARDFSAESLAKGCQTPAN